VELKTKPLSMDEMWAIGLFEGEGSIVFMARGNSVVLSLQMTDEDVVRRFGEIMRCGRVAGPFKHKDYKPTWYWRVYKNNDIVAILQRWMPYLGERRAARSMAAVVRLANYGKRKKQIEGLVEV
jgi:hypothetical protein